MRHPDRRRPPGRYALLLHGFYGGIHDSPQTIASKRPSRLDFRVVEMAGLTQLNHIIQSNAISGGVDVFAHSWNRKPAGELLRKIFCESLVADAHDASLRRRSPGWCGARGAWRRGWRELFDVWESAAGV